LNSRRDTRRLSIRPRDQKASETRSRPLQGQNPRLGLRFRLRRRGTGGLTPSIRCAPDTWTMSSTKQRWTKCGGVPGLGHVINQLAVHQLARFTDHATRQTHLESLDIRTSQVTPDPIYTSTEGAPWGSIPAHGMLCEIVIVSDGTGQFAVGRPAQHQRLQTRRPCPFHQAQVQPWHSQSLWPRLLRRVRPFDAPRTCYCGRTLGCLVAITAGGETTADVRAGAPLNLAHPQTHRDKLHFVSMGSIASPHDMS
jgi:hypothetical protein